MQFFKHDFYIHIWPRKSTRPIHWFLIQFSSVTICFALTWWHFSWTWHHSLLWECWHHLPHQINTTRPGQNWHPSLTSVYPSMYPNPNLNPSPSPSSSMYWLTPPIPGPRRSFISHLLWTSCSSNLVAVNLQLAWVVVNELFVFNYLIFWLVTFSNISPSIPFPCFFSLDPVLFSIPNKNSSLGACPPFR